MHLRKCKLKARWDTPPCPKPGQGARPDNAKCRRGTALGALRGAPASVTCAHLCQPPGSLAAHTPEGPATRTPGSHRNMPGDILRTRTAAHMARMLKQCRTGGVSTQTKPRRATRHWETNANPSSKPKAVTERATTNIFRIIPSENKN